MPRCLRAPAAHRVEIVESPCRDPGPGYVRVRVRHCGICGSDLHFFLGRHSPPVVCPGHEFSGEIDAVGAAAGAWREGDRVAVEPLARCRRCQRCRGGEYNLCNAVEIYGIHRDGAMASELVVPAYTLFALPSSLDLELGALNEPLAVGVHALRLAKVAEGSRVLVLGAGTIGLLSAVAARHLGAEHVAITARHAQQREAAMRMGADEVLDPEQPRPSPPPNVVIETVGGEAATVVDAIEAVTYAGTVVIVGLFETAPAFDPLTMMIKEARMVSSMVYNRPDRRADFEIALDILAGRGEDLRTLITHRFALDDAQTAFETAADKSTGALKVLLQP